MRSPKCFAPALLAAGLPIAGCASEPPPAPKAPPPPASAAPAPPPPADPLGDKPELGPPQPFDPPAPDVFETANGMTVWLFERHSLPIVSAAIVVPYGAASDPPDAAGLAHVTADMLDEGAGKRSAVELSTAITDLGATLATGAGADGSFASLTTLKKNLEPAFGILADVVARPRLEPKEWKRVSELWVNDLRKRADDPASVSRVVASAALYGRGTPYGHPADGFVESARNVDLGDVKAFYATHWRPDRAVLVVAGDLTKAEVTRLADSALGTWKAPKGREAPPEPPADRLMPAGERPRVVLVDRPGAPQSVIAVVREGVRASDPSAPLLDLVNTALGGSFTSRLNQNLREEHGWSYGARSAFGETRGTGPFVARASVVTEATGPALKEMLGELTKIAASGLTPDELRKVRAQDRADLVQTYEKVTGVSRRLGSLAMLGLPPGFDAAASRARQAATLEALAELAKTHLDPSKATVVVVGPRAQVAPQLAAIGLPEPELWDAEAKPVTAGKGDGASARSGGAASKGAGTKAAKKK